MKSKFEERLIGGKALSLGNTVEVVQEVLEAPESFSDYLKLFSSKEPQVVLRAANGLKRIFDERPEWFEEQRAAIIPLLQRCPHDSARWTLVQLLKKYKRYLNEDEIEASLAIARQFLLESTEWITLVQSMDVLILFKKPLTLDEELKTRLELLSLDTRKAVANKATKLLKTHGSASAR